MFIVLEGIDGAGKGKQREEVVKSLSSQGTMISTVGFPDHDGMLYNELIHPSLHEEIELSKEATFVTFALDQLLWQDRILPSVQSRSHHFVADGYFTTNIVYQCLVHKNFTLEEALHFAETFNILKPDVIVYVDVDPRVAMKRKEHEEGHEEGLDKYERSIQKQEAIREGFHLLEQQQIFGRWMTVDGHGTISETTNTILEALRKHQIIA